MTQKQMALLMEEIFKTIQKTRDAGQKEYARNCNNAFANFERISDNLDIQREEVLLVYLLKHIDGICSHVKGNISQLYEKYSKLAKESSSSGDRIQAEYYYQFADHYSRLMNELGLKSFGNENKSESVSESVEEKTTPNEEQMTQDNEKNVLLNENILEKDSESIETVSFIAEPAKKSIQKSKKK